jgi:two-component system phosphate regulon sensor histidine kinase PhoR
MQDVLRKVLEGVPLPALLIGPDERLAGVNPAALALLGEAAAAGRHHGLVLRQPDMQQAIGAAFARGQAGQARHRVPGPSQDSQFRATITPLGADQGVLVVFEDLTEAEQIGQMRRDFVANVSHELRSPLTALTGFIETLRGAARDDAAARERFLAIMEREAGRMNRLVRDLLHLSRVEAEERVRPTTRIALVDVLKAPMASLRPLAEASGVRLVLEGEEVPSTLPGDADQLVQVFQNLIENAVKYGGAGGEVTVRLSPDRLPKAAAVRVDVIDRGEGIDEVHLPRLTERFYRVDGHRAREKGGTGLGLAIVKHIVQRHRGRLQVHSRKGEGSTFSVILPLE